MLEQRNPSTQLYNYDGMANDLREILDAEEVDKATVIGHDWGHGSVTTILRLPRPPRRRHRPDGYRISSTTAAR